MKNSTRKIKIETVCTAVDSPVPSPACVSHGALQSWLGKDAQGLYPVSWTMSTTDCSAIRCSLCAA
ncbi:MAG: hypothetical protein WCO86_02640 [Planctomycetota bacterium]